MIREEGVEREGEGEGGREKGERREGEGGGTSSWLRYKHLNLKLSVGK